MPELTLFCGWRRDIGDMILLLDEFVSPGSELTILSEVSVPQRLQHVAYAGGNLKNPKPNPNLNPNSPNSRSGPRVAQEPHPAAHRGQPHFQVS